MFVYNKRLIPWLLGVAITLLTSVATIGSQSPLAFAASSQSCAQQCGSTTDSCFTACVNGQPWCQNGNSEDNNNCSSSSCTPPEVENSNGTGCTDPTSCPGGQYNFAGCASYHCATVKTENMPACTPSYSTTCHGTWADQCAQPSSSPPTTSPTSSSPPPSSSNPPPSSSNPPPTSSNPPPSCTAPPGGARSYSGSFVPNGCAGSCSSTGCSPTHEETGTITTTTVHTWYTCPGPTEHSSTSQSIQNTTASSSTNCAEITKPLSCVKNKPGYAWEENCLVCNGQDTHCSQPFQHYDPINCPVPVPVNN